MRRLLRWTFNALAMASLLLCLATAGLWVRSYWVYDQFVARRLLTGDKRRLLHPFPKYKCSSASYRGRLGGWLHFSDQPQGQTVEPWEFELLHPDELFASRWTNYRFNEDRAVSLGVSYTEESWSLPDWSLVSAFALLPAIVTFRQVRAVRRRRRRSRLGLCPACGYDLRASPERCPECGRVDDKVTR